MVETILQLEKVVGSKEERELPNRTFPYSNNRLIIAWYFGNPEMLQAERSASFPFLFVHEAPLWSAPASGLADHCEW